MPRVEKLLLAAADYDRIVAHAKEGLPNEACGLIAGTVAGEGEAAVGTVEHVYLLTNIDESNEHFSMDPREQLAAVKDARAHSWEMLGNWHSHPESPSRPSEEDKRLAFDSTAAYLILSLMDPEHLVLNAFHVEHDKQVARVPLEVVEAKA